MRLLIIGGTGFLGQHLTNAALARGHIVTHFNRDVTRRHPDNRVERLRGDRDADLACLGGRRWDAVIDTCAYFPRQVASLARALADATDHYVLVSTVNCYRDLDRPGLDETAPVSEPDFAPGVTLDADSYGALKAACEIEATGAFVGRSMVVRPGYIVGPRDPNPCFAYWSHRISLGGRFLAPGLPTAPWQFIDVRDLSDWLVASAEGGLVGTFNAVGPGDGATIGGIIAEMAAAVAYPAGPIWVDPAFILAQARSSRWLTLASWVTRGRRAWLYALSSARARAAGLRSRPVQETMRDVLDAIALADVPGPTNAREQADEDALIRRWWQFDAASPVPWLERFETQR